MRVFVSLIYAANAYINFDVNAFSEIHQNIFETQKSGELKLHTP